MTTTDLRNISLSHRSLSIVLHLAGLLSFTASFLWLPNITNPLHGGFGGSYQFLTIIALTLSTITFGTGLLADVLPYKPLYNLKSWLSICATPLEVLVTVLYWALHTIDRRFVVPPGHELPFIPDLGFHAVPAIVLTLDLMFLSPPWTIDVYGVISLGLVLAISYWGWVEYCFLQNGWYPYPLLMQLHTWQKLLLCIISASLMTGSTIALKWVYGLTNRVKALRKEN
ncbi:FAR-17a/AIG1-like protein [Xylogone sp. PMI_703]|nr:FAR-17a/AIG1-like protein [Xylogone sp. PMI_703]